MATHQIAVLAGDGIGKEVMPEGLRVLEAAARKFRLDLAFTSYDWSCDYYAKHGRMMPEDWFAQLSPFEAIYYGAVGWPATVPDHVSLWGSLILFRRQFDQYVNLRPSCARTPKASTRRSAAACTKAPTARSCSSSPCSRARASIAS